MENTGRAEHLEVTDGGNDLGRSWLVLIAATLAALFLYSHSTSFAPFLTVVAEDLNVDPGQAAQMFTARLWGDAFFLLFCGALADRLGLRFVLVAGSLATVLIMSGVYFFGSSLNRVLFFYFMLGLPGGMIFPCIGSLCVTWFPGRYHGLGSGIFLCAGVTAGYGLGPVLGPIALELTGHWKSAVFSLSVLNVLAAIMALIVVTKPARKFFEPDQDLAATAAGGKVSIIKLCLKPVTIVGSLVVVCISWAYLGIANYVGTFVAEAPPIGLGRGEAMGGQMAFILSMAALAGGLLGGVIYDRLFNGRARAQFLIGILLEAALLLALLSVVRDNMFLFALVMIICGLGSQIVAPITYATASRVYPEGTASTMIGIWWGVGTWGSGLGLYLGGRSLEATGSLDTAMLQFGLAAVAGFILVLLFWNEKFLKVKV